VTEDPNGEAVAIMPLVTRALENREWLWGRLHDLAHALGTDPEALRESLRAELAQTHQDEIAALRAEYESKLKTLQENQFDTQAQMLKERLLRLSSMAAREDNATGEAGS
jgi:hypothetical protein